MVEAVVQQDHLVKLMFGKHTSQCRLQQRTAQVLPQGMDSGKHHKQCRVGVAQEACKRTNAIVLMSTISLPAWQSLKAEKETILGIVGMVQHGLLKLAQHSLLQSHRRLQWAQTMDTREGPRFTVT